MILLIGRGSARSKQITHGIEAAQTLDPRGCWLHCNRRERPISARAAACCYQKSAGITPRRDAPLVACPGHVAPSSDTSS